MRAQNAVAVATLTAALVVTALPGLSSAQAVGQIESIDAAPTGTVLVVGGESYTLPSRDAADPTRPFNTQAAWARDNGIATPNRPPRPLAVGDTVTVGCRTVPDEFAHWSGIADPPAVQRCFSVHRDGVLVYPADTPYTRPLVRDIPLAPIGPEVEPGTNAMDQIRALCLERWPRDFQMQAFCQDQQLEALRRLR